MTNLSSTQSEFIASVLSLKPPVAAFDCDGTLWSGDAGEGFFSRMQALQGQTHRAHVLRKLAVHSIVDLVRFAARHQIPLD